MLLLFLWKLLYVDSTFLLRGGDRFPFDIELQEKPGFSSAFEDAETSPPPDLLGVGL